MLLHRGRRSAKGKRRQARRVLGLRRNASPKRCNLTPLWSRPGSAHSQAPRRAFTPSQYAPQQENGPGAEWLIRFQQTFWRRHVVRGSRDGEKPRVSPSHCEPWSRNSGTKFPNRERFVSSILAVPTSNWPKPLRWTTTSRKFPNFAETNLTPFRERLASLTRQGFSPVTSSVFPGRNPNRPSRPPSLDRSDAETSLPSREPT